MVLSVGIGAEYLMHGTVQQRGKNKPCSIAYSKAELILHFPGGLWADGQAVAFTKSTPLRDSVSPAPSLDR